MANAKNSNQEQTNGRTASTQNNVANTDSNAVKNPDEWTTGDEAMTGAQHSYLKTLSDEAGVEMDDTLTKADASKRIDELQHQTGRGLEDKK